MQAKMVEGVCVIEEKEELEPEGVKIDWNLSKWSMPFAQKTLAAMEGDKLTVKEAWNSDEHLQWKKVMEEEIHHIDKVGTWTPVVVPKGANVLKSLWVLIKKCNAFGAVSRYKARLVIGGYGQIYGIDFYDTYAPVVCLATLRALLSVAATTGTTVAQVDAKNAYLYATLDPNKILYMKLPDHLEEFILLPSDLAEMKQQGKNIVLHLWWPLYGSKQGAYKFYKHLVRIVKSIGYTVSNHDPSVYH